MRKLQVAVIGDSQTNKTVYDFCEQLGIFLAQSDFTVITGGRGGVMEAVSKGAFTANGLTIGILPSDELNDGNKYCYSVIPTGMGNSRNSIIVQSADIIIAIGGQAGTLSELAFSWISNKPIICVEKFGGWSSKLSGQIVDSRRNEPIIGVNTLEELKSQVLYIAKSINLNKSRID